MCFQWKWRFTFTVACGGKVNGDICRLRWKCSGLSSSLPPSSRKLSRSRRRRSSWRSLLSSHSLLSLPPFKIETLKAFVFIHLLFCRLHLTSLPFLDSKLECCFILRQWWTLSQQEWMFYPEFCLHIPSCQSSSLAHSILECCSNSRQWRTQTGKRQCSRSRSRKNYSKSGARRMSPFRRPASSAVPSEVIELMTQKNRSPVDPLPIGVCCKSAGWSSGGNPASFIRESSSPYVFQTDGLRRGAVLFSAVR